MKVNLSGSRLSRSLQSPTLAGRSTLVTQTFLTMLQDNRKRVVSYRDERAICLRGQCRMTDELYLSVETLAVG